MKKVLIVCFAFFAVMSTTDAQVMKHGDNAVNIGIGIPAVANNIKLPAFIAAFDHGFSNKLGIGYISGGALASISKGGYSSWGVEYSRTYFIIGPRAAYHFDFKDISGNSAFDKLDIYAGVFAGMSIEPYKEKWAGGTYSKTYTHFHEDVFIGARYAVSNSFNVYAEAGYNTAFISAGASFRF